MLYVRPAARLRGVTTGELQTRTANLNLVPESPTPCALPPPPSSPQPSYDIKRTPLRIMLAVQADLLAGNPGPTDSDPVIASSNLAPPLTVSAAPTAPIRIAGSRRNATCTRPACQAAARSPVLPLSRLSPVHQKCTSPCPAPPAANPAPSLSAIYHPSHAEFDVLEVDPTPRDVARPHPLSSVNLRHDDAYDAFAAAPNVSRSP